MKEMIARPIALSQIVRREDQPREVFDEEGLVELAESIREQGLQQPIKVRPLNGTRKYQIVMGERRWRATQKLGAETILAFVEEMDDEKAYTLALMENLARRDLDPVEEARGYQMLAQTYGWTTEQIAEKLGKPAFHVRRLLEILPCRPDVLELVRHRRIPIEQPCIARVMARLSYNGQGRMLRAMNDGKMTWDEVLVLANAIWGEENQAQMFSDVALTDDQVEVGRKVRSAIDRAAAALQELMALGLDEDEAGAALAHDLVVLEAKVSLLLRGLRRIRLILRRRKVREMREDTDD